MFYTYNFAIQYAWKEKKENIQQKGGKGHEWRDSSRGNLIHMQRIFSFEKYQNAKQEKKN